jgi:hypothetical protein
MKGKVRRKSAARAAHAHKPEPIPEGYTDTGYRIDGAPVLRGFGPIGPIERKGTEGPITRGFNIGKVRRGG